MKKRSEKETKSDDEIEGSDNEKSEDGSEDSCTHLVSDSLPHCLTRHGIVKLYDNVPPGGRVEPSMEATMDLFGDALKEKFLGFKDIDDLDYPIK